MHSLQTRLYNIGFVLCGIVDMHYTCKILQIRWSSGFDLAFCCFQDLCVEHLMLKSAPFISVRWCILPMWPQAKVWSSWTDIASFLSASVPIDTSSVCFTCAVQLWSFSELVFFSRNGVYALKYGYTKGEHGHKPWILVGPPNIFSRKKALFPVQERSCRWFQWPLQTTHQFHGVAYYGFP